MNDEVVTRLYRCLVEELQRRGHSEEEPLRVSQLYQDLVPYRAVRSTLGVELNADYEHALLRLLAGERDLLRLEPPEAREELRREVDNPYPFVGLFRKFSASGVWVSMSGLGDRPARPARPRAAEPADPTEGKPVLSRAARAAQKELELEGDGAATPASDPGGAIGPAAPVRVAAEAEGAPVSGRRGGAAPARAPMPVQIHRPDAEVDPTHRLTHAGADCVFCADPLPAGRRVRFCPHCGGDQRLRPCPRCDAVLEREWRYCISCGHDVARS